VIEVLAILGKASTTVEPSNGALHDSAAWQRHQRSSVSLLAEQNIDPASGLVLRHTPKPEDGQLRKVLPGLAEEHPDVFNAYQSTQVPKVEAAMRRAKYVTSFIGLEKRQGSTEQAVVFVGLYKIGDHRPLTYTQFWDVQAYQKMKEQGNARLRRREPSFCAPVREMLSP
jgi:hypothetical protein